MKKVKTKQELFEAVVAQFTAKLRDGKKPKIATYLDRYPKFALELEELLVSVEMIEGLKDSAGSDIQHSLQRRMDSVLNLERVGDYDIIREVGRGGMGIVFEAVHRSLGRRVAIKVMPTSSLQDEKYITRFRREAQAAARLHHTNIVSVFGVGQHEGNHYYVMEFIDGENLSGVVRAMTRKAISDTSPTVHDQTRQVGNTQIVIGTPKTMVADDTMSQPHESDDVPELRLDTSAITSSKVHIPTGNKRFRWAADLASQIADAMAYAHGQGTLHRDIKPSNLLLDQKGQVWITDFGLVKDASHHTLTGTGDIIGTPQYMCPESFEGKYDQRSETYCLGLTLYELVTLQPAFSDTSTAELIKAVTTSTPISPRKIDSRIPADLNTIIEKAISREPEARYQTAEAIRDDLRAYLSDRTISARRPSAIGQAVRWAKRNPLTAALGGLSVALLSLVAVTAVIAYWVTNAALADVSSQAETLRSQKKTIQELLDNSKENSKRIAEGLAQAQASVEITIEMFDEMFKQIVSGPDRRADLDINGFKELAGVETAVTEEDAAFLRKMLTYYEKFADQNSNNEQIQADSARVYRRVANLYHLVGDLDVAIRAYQKSLKAGREQLNRSEMGIDATVEFVQTKNELAMAIRRKGVGFGQARAKASFEKITNETVRMLRNHPHQDSAKLRFALANTLQIQGTGESLTTITSRMRIPRGQNAQDKNNDRRWGGLTEAESKTAAARLGDAIEIIDDLLRTDQSNMELKAERAKCYCSLAAHQFRFNQVGANVSLRIATSQFEKLLKENPLDPQLKFNLALALVMPRTGAQGTSKSAYNMLGRTIEICTDLTEKHPRVLEYHQLLIIAYIRMSIMDARSHGLQKALDTLELAGSAFQTLRQETAADSRFQREFNNRITQLKRLLTSNLKDNVEVNRKFENWARGAFGRNSDQRSRGTDSSKRTDQRNKESGK